MLFHGDTFTRAGHNFRFRVVNDPDIGAPWDHYDMHGPVSDWRVAEGTKRPGELVLCTDRHLARFYDFAEACKLARGASSDGAAPWVENGDRMRERAAKAARADFERLKAWCDGRWYWAGVVVELLDDDGEPTERDASLWGIESDAGDYLETVARELADQVLAEMVPSGLDALRAIVSSDAPACLADPVL